MRKTLKKAKKVVLGYKKGSKVKVEKEKSFFGVELCMEIFIRFLLNSLFFHKYEKKKF